MAPRRDVSAERTAQILTAAAKVFAQGGFAQTRMEDIAQAAGVSKGTLYLYFNSKDALITGLLRSIFDSGFAALSALLDQPGSVSARLLAWTAQTSADTSQQQLIQALGYEFYAAAARDQHVMAIVRSYYQRYTAALVRLIEQGIERGELQQVDAAEIAVTLIALYEGMNLLLMTAPSQLDLSRTTYRAVERLLNSIAAAAA